MSVVNHGFRHYVKSPGSESGAVKRVESAKKARSSGESGRKPRRGLPGRPRGMRGFSLVAVPILVLGGFWAFKNFYSLEVTVHAVFHR